ncbi:MAG: class I mannose-6-phosphate isomerase [Bacteroidales bacterium]|nr:class I mannose-6-phosphate isomerase [Bacteroidales bacterium]
MLYPLKFNTIYKEKIWGGNKVKTILNKDYSPLANCGETWEISGLKGFSNQVKNGFLKGNTLEELVSVYMGDLVGEKVFQIYGETFPLLIKFIDANDDLSVQVHPNNTLAEKFQNDYGKTEMWYVLQADANAKINIGFNTPMTKEKLEKHIQSNSLEKVLNYVDAKAGDIFYIPAGKVHAIGKGVLLTEIQQSSDITYRLYDYQRKDTQGNLRPLHIQEAYQAIDYENIENNPIRFVSEINTTLTLVCSPFFVTNHIYFDKQVEKIYADMDTFVIYICLEGETSIHYHGGKEILSKGECILIPATIEDAVFEPHGVCKLLETYLP